MGDMRLYTSAGLPNVGEEISVIYSETPDRSKAVTPSTAGLILLDIQNRVVYHNPEALKILAYPGPAKVVLESLPGMLQPLLQAGRGPNAVDFSSGRRRYVTRLFALGQASGKTAQAMNGILLERVAPSVLGISSAAQQFRLTRREQETVELLTLGLTSKEIASRMNISPNTVKAFFRLVMTKMAVSTRSGILGKLARMQSPA